ncbi:MAG: N-acetylmuramoyl-L-alanine amidase [Lachnospiraceae bacterium]|nr:N-acetylmuramoyl-L-alanine amidase [Lachnospiraceae bacterium]
MKNKLLKKIAVIALTAGLTIGTCLNAFAVTVCLDPGHGGVGSSGPGAIYPPYIEKYLTLDVASRVKSELEAAGITTYMTRSADVPLGLAERAAYAKSVNADLLVSIHFNASGPHDKFGTEVWTSAFGNGLITGIGLGNYLLQQFTALGFTNKGVKTKLGENGDYYGVIRYGTAVGIPTVIVEQCFIDNPIDRTIMASKGAAALAHADAQGIINYLKSLGVATGGAAAAPAAIETEKVTPTGAASTTHYGFPIDPAGNVTYSDGSGAQAVFSAADWNWLLSQWSYTPDPEAMLKTLPAADLQKLVTEHAEGKR